MKPVLLAALLASCLLHPALAAKTPRIVNEYFYEPFNPLSLGSHVFQAQAMRRKTAIGTEWFIRLSIQLSYPTVSDGPRYLFFLTLDEAQEMMEVSQELLDSDDEARQSPANLYEKRVGVTDQLDMVYRRVRASGAQEFWITRSGNLNAANALVLDKSALEAIMKSLGVAIKKADISSDSE